MTITETLDLANDLLSYLGDPQAAIEYATSMENYMSQTKDYEGEALWAHVLGILKGEIVLPVGMAPAVIDLEKE